MNELLITRILTPPVRPGLVARERLRTVLRAGFAQGLTLITAPAGSGKTTLLTQALADAQADDPRLGVAWLALDAGDNDPVRFWRYLLAALERAAPGAWQHAEVMLRAAATHPGEALVTALLNSAAALEHPLLLVLDDYHLISTPEIHTSLALLIEYAPPQLRVVLASRTVPPLPLERLRVRRSLTELRPADLGFTLAEAQALFGPVLGLELDPPAMAALVARTEGWGAGLILAAHSARNRSHPTQVATLFSGAAPAVLDYVIGEVLAGQPVELRTFLLQTAALDRFSVELCAAVLDPVASEPAAQALLDQVDRANLFLIALDDEQRWFRYHHLFAEALRTALARSDPDQLRATRRKAATWLAEHSAPAEAIGYALAAEAWPLATELIGTMGQSTLLSGEVATLQNWLAALPQKVVQQTPRLLLLNAWMRVLSSDLDGATQLAGNVTGNDHLGREAQMIATTVAILRGHPAPSALLEPIQSEPADDPFLQAMAALNGGFMAQFAGDVKLAIPNLNEAARLGAAHRNDLITFIALCQLGEIELLRGRPRAAAARYAQARTYTRDPAAPAALLDSAAQEGLGVVAYELGDLAQAHDLISVSLDDNSVLDDLAAVDAHLCLADIATLQNDRERIDTHLAAADNVAQRLQLTVFTNLVAAHSARINARTGRLAAAVRWMEQVDAAPDRALPLLVYEIEDLTRAHVLSTLGRPAAALVLAERVAATAAAADRGRHLVEAHILRSQALRQLGRLAEALEVRTAAEHLARPEGLVAVFLEAGEPPPDPVILPVNTEVSPDQLTEREQEVLRLIAAGLSNQEIAEHLIVAPSTVKKHINRLFAKLAVSSRTQALVLARERGMI